MSTVRPVDASGRPIGDLRELFGDAPLSQGPYRLISIEGTDGIWRCRHCRAYFLGAVPHRPPEKCAKCAETS
jgi:hypothetical protein